MHIRTDHILQLVSFIAMHRRQMCNVKNDRPTCYHDLVDNNRTCFAEQGGNDRTFNIRLHGMIVFLNTLCHCKIYGILPWDGHSWSSSILRYYRVRIIALYGSLRNAENVSSSKLPVGGELLPNSIGRQLGQSVPQQRYFSPNPAECAKNKRSSRCVRRQRGCHICQCYH